MSNAVIRPTYPHPDNPSVMVPTVDIPWSTPEAGKALTLTVELNDTVKEFMAAFEKYNYTDSIDREWAFTMATEKIGCKYNDLYTAWIG